MLLEFEPEMNVLKLDGIGVSLHCHHFNCGLVKALEEMEGIDARSLIIQAAQEEFHDNFTRYILNHLSGAPAEEKLKTAAELYRFMGFGRIDLSRLSGSGGKAYADSSYYVTGWLAKYERRTTPVCHLTCGFLSGILSAVYEKPLDTYRVEETMCMISGQEQCEFLLTVKE
ncbi:MAG: 4-vinyl reductase [Thermodesulfovibrionales bacterium]|nr:4-vinyl reductase [Thermodesulfovibrionales bacterium]